MKTKHFLFALLAMASGCATRQTLVTVPAVSMTRPSMDRNHVAQPGNRVTAEYCKGDTPITREDGNVGLIDEAVLKAQRVSDAEYLRDVTISQAGDCVRVEGVAMR